MVRFVAGVTPVGSYSRSGGGYHRPDPVGDPDHGVRNHRRDRGVFRTARRNDDRNDLYDKVASLVSALFWGLVAGLVIAGATILTVLVVYYYFGLAGTAIVVVLGTGLGTLALCHVLGE